jgi:hypothetical protein
MKADSAAFAFVQPTTSSAAAFFVYVWPSFLLQQSDPSEFDESGSADLIWTTFGG